jgi:hypothetical protein
MQIAAYKDDLYVAYGWSKTGGRDKSGKRVSEIHIKKIKNASDRWTQEERIPYKTGAKLFISQSGDPYLLYVAQDAIYQTKFSKETGTHTTTAYNKPTEPARCFPQGHTMRIVDVFADLDGNDNIALSSNPLNSPEAGCATIGIARF